MLSFIIFLAVVYYVFQLGVLAFSILNGVVDKEYAVKLRLIFFIPFLPLIVGLYLKSKERSWK